MPVSPVAFTNCDNLHFTICWGNIYFFISSDLGSGGCFNHHNIFINTSWWGKRKKKVCILPSISGIVIIRDYYFPRLKIHIGREFHGVCQNFRCTCQIHDLIIPGSNSAVNIEVKKKGRGQKIRGGVCKICKLTFYWKQLWWILLAVIPMKFSHLI